MPRLLLALLLFALPQERRDALDRDRVELKGGRVLTGQVVFADEERVGLRRGNKLTFQPVDEVQLLDARMTHLDELLERLAALGPPGRRSPDALLELARFARHGRLPDEARLLAAEVLLGDPHSEEAAELAGAHWRGKHLEFSFGGQHARLEQLRDGARPWKQRVSLDSAHYRLQTNLPLDQALALAIDLERFESAFRRLFASDLDLLDPADVMQVNCHADRKSFPRPGSGRDGSFDPDDRIARALVDRPPWRAPVFHEVTRQLLFHVTRRAPSGRGELPLWFEAGLARAMASGLSGVLGATRFDPSRPDPTDLALHAATPRPLGLARVLILEPLDLENPRHSALAYAECDTLVSWLLFGGQVEIRTGALRFLHHAMDGKSGKSRFLDDMGLESDELQRRWFAWVAARAGR